MSEREKQKLSRKLQKLEKRKAKREGEIETNKKKE
jgi:hypothetical protein